jgi:S-DNA-T family DNA segregation ATPase FtsK/SpoIIIE
VAAPKRRPSARPKTAQPAKASSVRPGTLAPTTPPELAGILALAAAALILGSLGSYSPEDLNGAVGSTETIQNTIGPAGAYISAALFSMLGCAAYIMGLAILTLAVQLLRRQERLMSLRTGVGMALAMVAATGLAQIWVAPETFSFRPGGLLGLVVSSTVVGMFSQVGASIILSTLGLLALSELIGVGPRGIAITLRRLVRFDSLKSALQKRYDELSARWGMEADERKQRRAEQKRFRSAERAERKQDKADAKERVKAAKKRQKEGTEAPDNVVEFMSETPGPSEGSPTAAFEEKFFASEGLVSVVPEASQEQVIDPVSKLPRQADEEPAWVAKLKETAKAKNPKTSAEKESTPAVENQAASVEEPKIVAVPLPKVPLTDAKDQLSEGDKARAILRKKMGRKKKRKSRGEWELPSMDLLAYKAPEVTDLDTEWLQATARKITDKLAEFRITGKVIEIRPGPTVTLYEFEPGPGIKVSKISGYADDLQMALGARSVRVIAPLPMKSTVGIEVPNRTRLTVYLKELLADPAWAKSKAALPMALGRDGEGRSFYMDLAKTPHLLVAGGTGSGKSVGVNTMILSMLYRFSPADLRLLLIDPKMLEFAPYNDIPHLLVPPITHPAQATVALAWACKEMDRRYEVLAKAGVKNIEEYNQRLELTIKERAQARKELNAQILAEAEAAHAEMQAERGPDLKMVMSGDDESEMQVVERQAETVDVTDDGSDERKVTLPPDHALSEDNDPESMPYIIIVVDEFADLMMTAGKDIEDSVGRLAQKARAAGMHVILATQRPSVDVVTGVIKVNFPSRISFRVSASQDSKTILGRTGAERLLGNGDMLVVPPNSSDPSRVQGAFVSTEELTKIINHLRSQGEPDYDESITAMCDASSEGMGSDPSTPYDALWMDCLRIAANEGQVSTSWLQRRLSIGYTRAGRIIDRMEAEGLVGPSRGAKPREVFITVEQLDDPDAPFLPAPASE